MKLNRRKLAILMKREEILPQMISRYLNMNFYDFLGVMLGANELTEEQLNRLSDYLETNMGVEEVK